MTLPVGYRPTVPLDADGRVCVNAPCLNCGYNLRTLSVEGLCPECAHPVRLSTQGHFLRFAAPPWVRRLARGVLLLIISVAVLMGGSVLLPAVMGALIAIAAPTGPPPLSLLMFMSTGQFAFGAVTLVLVMIGLWLVTSRDPAGRTQPEGFTARRVVRVCTWLVPVPLVLGLLMLPYWASMMPPTPPASPFAMFTPTFTVFAVLSGVSSLVIFVATPLALLRYLMALMGRIPRPGLVRFAQVEFWGGLVSGVVLTGGYAWMILFVFIPMFSAPPRMVPVPATGAGVTTTGPAVSVRSVSAWQGTTYTTSYSYVAPPGQTAVTTPTSIPTTMMAVPSPPPIGVGFFVVGAATTAGWCGTLGFVIAGFVLLILVQRALSRAAREAAQNAGEPQPVLAQPLKHG